MDLILEQLSTLSRSQQSLLRVTVEMMVFLHVLNEG